MHRFSTKGGKDITEAVIHLEEAAAAPADQPAVTSVEVRRPSWWRQTLPVALGISAVAVFVTWSLTRPEPPPPSLVSRFAIPLVADQNFSFAGRPLVAISPDGSQIVYVANQGLWLRSVDQLRAVQIQGTEQGRGPFFAADGQSIGFWAGGQLKKVSVSGGAAVTLADVPSNPFGASWGSTGGMLPLRP